MKNIFREYRERFHVTQSQLADDLGVKQSAISNYEGGTRAPEIRIARRFVQLANRMGFACSLDDVYEGSSESNPRDDAA